MSDKQVFYIHGANSFSRYENFTSFLKTCEMRYPHGDKPTRWGSKLRDNLAGYEVFTPEMPNKQNAKYEEWKIWFERHFEFLHDDVTLVGWSQGAYFLLKYLVEQDTPFRVGNLILISAPVEPDDFGREDGGDFNFDITKLPSLSNKVSNIHIIHSKDDFVVPFEHALKLKEALPEAELHVFEDRNHFLQEDFPELIELIRDIA